jgi:hypothetical protein
MLTALCLCGAALLAIAAHATATALTAAVIWLCRAWSSRA